MYVLIKPLHPRFSKILRYMCLLKNVKQEKEKKRLNMLLFTKLFSSYGDYQCY